MAISVFAKIQSALKVELSLRVFFDNPRIKDIADHIDVILRQSAISVNAFCEDKSKSKKATGEI
jgi:hypothetical protein